MSEIEQAARALVHGQGSPWVYVGDRTNSHYGQWHCGFCVTFGTVNRMVHRNSCNWWRLEKALAAATTTAPAADTDAEVTP